MGQNQGLEGYEYMCESPVEPYMRDAKLLKIEDGTSEILKLIIRCELLEERRRHDSILSIQPKRGPKGVA